MAPGRHQACRLRNVFGGRDYQFISVVGFCWGTTILIVHTTRATMSDSGTFRSACLAGTLAGADRDIALGAIAIRYPS